jgi:hypothetical protein
VSPLVSRKKTPRPSAATSVVVVLLLALVRVAAAVLADTMLTLWSLIADIILLKIKKIHDIGQSVERNVRTEKCIYALK